MKKDGFLKLSKYIKDNKVKEISIIGGSHSGFSCAWLMLNGNATFGHNQEEPGKLPCAHKYFSKCCEIPDICNCLHDSGDKFTFNDWKFKSMIEESKVKVKILHREDIKVNFGSRAAAVEEEYT